MTKRAVLYARVSSDDRANEGRNLIGQLDMCRTHAQRKGWAVVAELAEDDRGASGAELGLPKLSELLGMASRKEFDVLIVREIDRLSRSLPKQLFIEDELKKAGVQIEYVQGDYPDTPEGNFMKNVRAAVAELERLKINERAMRGRIQAIKSGSVLVYNRPPYGYNVIHEEGKYKLEIREDEARIVRLVFEWYTKGDEENYRISLAEIARRLTQMGVPTYTDSRDRKQTIQRVARQGRWHQATVHKILKKTAYMGTWHFGQRRKVGTRNVPTSLDEQLPVSVPPIVDLATWNLAQARVVENARESKRNRKREYLLAGHVHCGLCNVRASGHHVKRETKQYHYYACNARVFPKNYRHSCDAPYFRGEPVDECVWNWLIALLTDPEALQKGLRVQQDNRQQQDAPMQHQLAHITEQIAAVQTQRERLLDLYLTGKISMPIWDERNNDLQEKLEKLTQEKGRIEAKLDKHDITQKQIDDIHTFARQVAASIDLASDNFKVKRSIIEMLDVEVALCVNDDGQKHVQASCILGGAELPIESRSMNGLSFTMPIVQPSTSMVGFWPTKMTIRLYSRAICGWPLAAISFWRAALIPHKMAASPPNSPIPASNSPTKPKS